MKFLNYIIYGLITFYFCSSLNAQTVKQIEVAENAPYVDHISLKPGTTDMDLLVKSISTSPITVSSSAWYPIETFRIPRQRTLLTCRSF